MAIEFKAVKIEKPADSNVIVGQAHFIKTVEDLYEAIVTSSASAKFGIGFCESSGECLVRVEGNDEGMKKLASENAARIAAGHSFVIILKNAYPINVLNAIKAVPEVCCIFCATANPAEIIIAETEGGKRGIMGVIDGEATRGIEGEPGVKWRKEILRKFGYKL